MSSNGERRPPHPEIRIVAPTASESEAAAIVAALEQFFAETAPAPGPGAATQGGWLRTALNEGVSARDLGDHAWGAP
jgi:hypothetical protein